jgi:hypothetical protein
MGPTYAGHQGCLVLTESVEKPIAERRWVLVEDGVK